ncbi:hypothetical protein B0H14DRAFT_2800502 [Mycena olivaceomarginata]|nr:hypothetical protein B0H14DRAFT_2800502 [Mycena olivaceomarginata]
MFRLCRLISVPSRVLAPGIHNQVNERTSASESGYVAAPPGYFSHDHALRYDDPLADCNSAFLARYYAIYKNWHRIRVALPAVWSCDWRRWDDGPHLSDLEKQVAWIYGVSTPVEPMAFFAGQCEPIFLFFTGGEYYFYDMGTLTRFEEHFTSHEDFLCRFGRYLHSGVLLPNVWHQ